eukprot:14472963-Alexandrium_andersonii.AAC.1
MRRLAICREEIGLGFGSLLDRALRRLKFMCLKSSQGRAWGQRARRAASRPGAKSLWTWATRLRKAPLPQTYA